MYHLWIYSESTFLTSSGRIAHESVLRSVIGTAFYSRAVCNWGYHTATNLTEDIVRVSTAFEFQYCVNATF